MMNTTSTLHNISCSFAYILGWNVMKNYWKWISAELYRQWPSYAPRDGGSLSGERMLFIVIPYFLSVMTPEFVLLGKFW